MQETANLVVDDPHVSQVKRSLPESQATRYALDALVNGGQLLGKMSLGQMLSHLKRVSDVLIADVATTILDHFNRLAHRLGRIRFSTLLSVGPL